MKSLRDKNLSAWLARLFAWHFGPTSRRLGHLLVLFCCVVLTAGAGLRWEATERSLTADPVQREIVLLFPFHNQGPATVTITGISTSCGCTAAELEQRSYASGTGGTIRIVLRPENTGYIEQYAEVTTDDPDNPSQRLLLKVAVPAERLQVFPRRVWWVVGAEPSPQTIHLRVLRQSDAIRPVTVTADGPGFRLELRAPDEHDPSMYKLTVTPEQVTEKASAIITVTTNQPEDSPLIYRLAASVREAPPP